MEKTVCLLINEKWAKTANIWRISGVFNPKILFYQKKVLK